MVTNYHNIVDAKLITSVLMLKD